MSSRVLRVAAGKVALVVAVIGILAVTPSAHAASGDIHTFAGSSVGQMTNGEDQAFMYNPGPRGDGGPAVDAALNAPRDVVFDAAGNTFIADAGDGRIRKVDPSGTITTFVETPSPISLAFSPAGELYWVSEDDNKVYRWHTNAFGITGVEHFAGSGATAYSGDGGPAVAAGLDPTDVAFDAAGNLLIVDSGNHRLRRVTPSGTISTFAGTGGTGMSGDYVLCDSDAGDGGPATAARICSPTAVAVDATGNVYVNTRPYAAHIKRIDTNGVISNFLGTGECVIYMTLGVPRLQATPCIITDLAIDAHGAVYVGVTRGFFVPFILRVDPLNGLVTRVAGKGCGYTAGGGYYIGCYAGDEGPALQAGLDNPIGYRMRSDGTLFFADSRNLRVRSIEPFGFASALPPAVSFPATEVSLNSPGRVASIRNTGMGPLAISGLGLEGPNAAEFVVGADGCTGRTLAPGRWCDVTLIFSPDAPGTRSAFLHVASNAPEGDEARLGFALTGAGITVPQLTITPSVTDFGNHSVGVPTTRTITVRSSGSGDVAIGALSLAGPAAGDYAIASDGCSGATLAPSQFCSVDVTFTPTAKGYRAAEVRVPTPTFTSVARLTGSAGQLVAVAPGSLSFGNLRVGAESTPKTVTVSNPGSDPLTVASVALVGMSAGHYRIAGDGCTASPVAPGASCAVSVSFAPGSLGHKAAALRVASDAPTPAIDVALSGIGVDVRAPVSGFTTPNGATVIRAVQDITGTATDDLAGVSGVDLIVRTQTGYRTVTASLACNGARTLCTWRARLPAGVIGPVWIQARARDAAANREFPGPAIDVTVV